MIAAFSATWVLKCSPAISYLPSPFGGFFRSVTRYFIACLKTQSSSSTVPAGTASVALMVWSKLPSTPRVAAVRFFVILKRIVSLTGKTFFSSLLPYCSVTASTLDALNLTSAWMAKSWPLPDGLTSGEPNITPIFILT